jgi:ribosomal protein S18 acetylase RimI-like enzyme
MGWEGKGMVIREFRPEDCSALVRILKANLQYSDPDTEGPEAMLRVHQCQAAVFLVAEDEDRPVGLIRGVYDGSKALIHIVSVDPAHQGRGIGSALVREAARRFKERGANNLAVTVPGDNLEFWKKLSFRMTTRIMFAHPIDSVINPARTRRKGG